MRWFRQRAVGFSRCAISPHFFVVDGCEIDLPSVAVACGLSAGACCSYKHSDTHKTQIALHDRPICSQHNRFLANWSAQTLLDNARVATNGNAAFATVGRNVGFAYELTIDAPMASQASMKRAVPRFCDQRSRKKDYARVSLWRTSEHRRGERDAVRRRETQSRILSQKDCCGDSGKATCRRISRDGKGGAKGPHLWRSISSFGLVGTRIALDEGIRDTPILRLAQVADDWLSSQSTQGSFASTLERQYSH
jgi:hypothetical protein